ncbi:serine/threonine-protein kinase [Sphingomonas sp.]|jgi:serine/threonine-protein kinase|uniref:serine/threonine-protein kinase n=1 Tax=Sphingomonas sp. TaxID=28214 RepID=UPI002D7E772E|nr:serine/threonine-protein kinase [Sphingomonas sp.]HEU0044793.1 serine/threonine-protein kinase [Sphingomonas sp.]
MSDWPPAEPPAPGDDEPRTVFMPSATPGGGESRAEQAPAAVQAQPRSAQQTEPPMRNMTTGGFQTQFAPREVGQGIQVGDVLNHIFEVRRFIARGGMGEVFEGVNVNTDERVAIKVMLPALAADPNVIGMFRKEARTLTRLQHEALVQYRVLAQEPQLGVLYIVTEYVDGANLADVLGQQQPTAADLILLLRRLASGLRVAHQLGAIHRDMSPDNVLLENGELAQAKIIDFGIAKDLDPGSKTIVGDGFAGKLNYVAPEQLGDFGREIGPWTDVYSLALVILAVALGKNVQMGGSLVDAVDKRRAGPDLSAAPEDIRPILHKMLAPNPTDRLRSMDEVLAELEPKVAQAVAATKPKTGLLVGAGVGVAALAAAAFLLVGRGGDAPAGGAGAPGVVAASADPVEVARSTLDATLPSVACTWLEMAKVEKAGDRVAVALTGVAGNPAAAQNEISRALTANKVAQTDIDFEAVSTITPSGCAALNAFRQIRSTDARRLTVPQTKFEMRTLQAPHPWAGRDAATAIVSMAIGDPQQDFALFGMEPSGIISDLVPSRQTVKEDIARKTGMFTDQGSDRYRLQLELDHSGWSGILLLTGKGPFEKSLVAPGLGARGPDWLEKFVSKAAANGWKADMVWFKTVDEVKE